MQSVCTIQKINLNFVELRNRSVLHHEKGLNKLREQTTSFLEKAQEWGVNRPWNIPETTTVENFDPNFPLDDNLHGEGCWFCNCPARMHSSAVRKWVLISRRCFTVPLRTSSATRSVNIQPTFWRPSSAASLSTTASAGSGKSFILSGVSSWKIVTEVKEVHRHTADTQPTYLVQGLTVANESGDYRPTVHRPFVGTGLFTFTQNSVHIKCALHFHI